MRSPSPAASASLAILLLAALFGSSPASADPPESALAVGTPAPAFALVDQAGETRALGDFLANGPVALLFYRSADW